MDTDRSAETANFFARLEDMERRLSRCSVIFAAKEYFAEAFGSWRIVAGTKDRRIDFSYDGNDSYLMYSDASVAPIE